MKKNDIKLLISTLFFLLIFTIIYQPTETSAKTWQHKIVSLKKANKKTKKIKQETIHTRKQLKNSYTNHILNMDKNFSYKISKKALKNVNTDLKKFWNELTDNPSYNELDPYADVSYYYNTKRGFLYLDFSVKYKIPKTKAQKMLERITPIIKTKEELINQMILHVNQLDKTFSLNLSKNISTFDDAFWDSLYEVPEFVDIYEYTKDFVYYTTNYKGYDKIDISCDYDITKQEINHLNAFINDWVEQNITPFMTEEEKIRTINDFMVREYRYTFGDNGEAPEGSPDYGKEKIGKYSVYSCFALLYEKGGVCDSKAKMFYRLAKATGLDVIYISGKVDSGLHAWNMIKIEDKWYHIDTTWNRGHYEGSSEYEYFNTRDYYLKSDSSMAATHSWNNEIYPAAYEDYPLDNLPPTVSNPGFAPGNLKQAA